MCADLHPAGQSTQIGAQCPSESIVIAGQSRQSRQIRQSEKGSRKQTDRHNKKGRTTQCNAQHAPGTCHGRPDSHCHKLELLINLQLL